MDYGVSGTDGVCVQVWFCFFSMLLLRGLNHNVYGILFWKLCMFVLFCPHVHSYENRKQFSLLVSISPPSLPPSLPFPLPSFCPVPPSPVFQVELMLYFCEASGVCHMQGAVLNIPLKCSDTAASPALTEILYCPEVPKTS